jgi:hypothetical protein
VAIDPIFIQYLIVALLNVPAQASQLVYDIFKRAPPAVARGIS